jgi:hypothetical protein
MDKYLTTDEFIGVITLALKNTLERDFGTDRKCHVVDLMTHATTGMEWMYQFVDAYGGVEYERQINPKVEDIEPISKKSKRTK